MLRLHRTVSPVVALAALAILAGCITVSARARQNGVRLSSYDLVYGPRGVNAARAYKAEANALWFYSETRPYAPFHSWKDQQP